MRFKLGLLFLLVCFCYSCSSQVPLRVKKNFKFCYEPTVNYSQSFIKLNGYYIFKNPPYKTVNYDNRGSRIENTVDTTFSTIMFFQDGVFVLGDTKSKRTFHEIDFLKKVEQQMEPESEQFYNGNYWGIYKIDYDTIKLQYISNQPLLNPYWVLTEVWYKILDENILEVVYAKDYIHKNKSHNKSIINIKFVKTDIILQSNTWLKSENWFWCDREKFKAWKKENKQQTKRLP